LFLWFEVSYLARLKAATSRKELAIILGYEPSSLTAIIYKTPDSQKYSTFQIDKKSGGQRVIKAPTPKLKKLQSHLSHVLYQCLDEIEKAAGRRPISFGFRKEQSIVENAARHKRRRWVLNIDLEDFFPSFNFGRVRGFFLKDKEFSLHPEVATTIAQIACDGTALPQGSPCSPVISELISQILDSRLLQLAKKYGVTYTRYADDISFSTSKIEFPVGIAAQDADDPTRWNLSDELTGKISRSGFVVNDAKTRMQVRGSRQMVTGLVVNDKVNIRSDYYRRARAMCDSLFETGKYFSSMVSPAKVATEPEPDLTDKLSQLEGILNHIYRITQSEERREVQEQRQAPRAIRKLYRRFLFYKYFIALREPLIVTEGKTDPVYLREAVRNLTQFHPVLGSQGKDGFKHAVRYFNYGGQASELLDLGGGGTSNLKSIPIDYRRNLNPSKKEPRGFKFRPMAFPVIVVLDNDDGLAPIASTIKQNFDVQFSTTTVDDFYHVTGNFYVVKTPEIIAPSTKAKSTYIEQLFPQTWLDAELNGKKFSPKNDIDTNHEYSKEVFAKSVIKPNARNIDFSGFSPLLTRIVKVLRHHAAI
jgi:retron-type reverse transcriptase